MEGPDAAKKAAAYDVEIEIDDPKKAQMNAFMMSSQNQQVHTYTRYTLYYHHVCISNYII